VHGSRGAYVADAFDFIAAYLVPENLWYIIPAEKIEGKEGIMISPKLETGKYRDYREAWTLLGAAQDAANQMDDGPAASVT
jgi:hypothetical protein